MLIPEYFDLIKQINILIQTKITETNENPENYQARIVLGNCYLAIGDFTHAFDIFHDLPRFDDDINFQYSMGIIQTHFQNYVIGIECFKRIISINPKFEFIDDVYFRLGILSRIQKDYELSIEYFTKVQPNKLGYLDEDILFQIGQTYFEQGNFTKAGDIFENLSKEHPQIIEAAQQHCIFSLLTNFNNISTVRKLVHYYIDIFKFDPILYLISALCDIRMDNISLAYNYYTPCINYYINSPYFWFGFGVIYVKNQQPNDAEVAFQRSLYFKDDIQESWLNLGMIAEMQNKFDHAIKYYQEAMTKCDDCKEFENRIRVLTSSRDNPNRRRNGPINKLVEVEYTKYFEQLPDQFGIEYLTSTPILPSEVFDIDVEVSKHFRNFSSIPKSIFLG